MMYPMNWFMMSLFLLFLLNFNYESSSMTIFNENWKKLFIKQIKWMW